MIIDKKPLPDDPAHEDAPPSYDTLSRAVSHSPEDKSFSLEPEPSPAHSPNAPSPSTVKGPFHTFLRSNSSKGKGKGPSNWFNFSSKVSSTRELRITILGLVRDLVRQPHQRVSSSATVGILESCADACTAYGLSLSSLLQEKSIEDHTPLYWAIIKRPPETPYPDAHTQVPDFLTILLSFSGPLSRETISEIRLACLLTSDQPLFQRLRLSPEFSPLSGTDEILLGATYPLDDIVVGDVPGDEGAFVVNFEIVQFQQRMRVSKRINLEFIARSRLWCFTFFVASELPKGYHNIKLGSWYISISLLEHSPPTWIDSRLVIEEPPLSPRLPPPPSLIDAEPPSPPPGQQPRKKPKPTITYRLKTGHSQLVPPQGPHSWCDGQNEIIVPLDDSMMGSGLQYSGSSYVLSNGTLRARLEARLAKPEPECIIC